MGEEQGPGYVKEVCWSPLGAARYGRCLLAVVATNHRLYVFEPVGHVEYEMRVAHELTPMMIRFGSAGLAEAEAEAEVGAEAEAEAGARAGAGAEAGADGADGADEADRKRLRGRCTGLGWSAHGRESLG